MREKVIGSLRKLRGPYIGDGYTKLRVPDVIKALNTLPPLQVHLECAYRDLKKGWKFELNGIAWSLTKVERKEKWPSRYMLERFKYSHEKDGNFYYKGLYNDGSEVVLPIADPGVEVAYVSAVAVGGKTEIKTFVIVKYEQATVDLVDFIRDGASL